MAMTGIDGASLAESAITRGLHNIAEAGAQVIESVAIDREAIMGRIKSTFGGTSTTISIGGVGNVDISTGAGALVLDDYLQELSTIEQAAAQLVAAENKAQKQVHSVTGQG